MFTFPTTLGDLSTSLYAVLEDCANHRARLRFQPCSETCPPVPTPCSGTVPTTEHVYVLNHARGLADQSLCRARGLCWVPIVLEDSSITPCTVLETCFDYSPTIAWGLLFSVMDNFRHLTLREGLERSNKKRKPEPRGRARRNSLSPPKPSGSSRGESKVVRSRSRPNG